MCAVSPCLSAFMDERCFPSGVFGPVLFRAFSALLRIFSGEVMGHLRFVRVTDPARLLNYHPVFDGNIVDNPALANCLPNSAGSLIDTFADIDTIGKVRQGMRRLWLPSLDWRREFGSRTKLGEEVGSECTRSAAS